MGYGDGAAAGVIPTNDGASCLFVSTTPRSGCAGSAAREWSTPISALLAAAGPALVARVRDRPSGLPGAGLVRIPGFARQSWGPGWALVGDAGYYKDPITSHGITDAFRDAALLADQVIAALYCRPRPRSAPWRTTRRTREHLSRDLFEVTEGVAAYDWDADGIRSLLHRFSASMRGETAHLEALTNVG